MIGLGLTGAQQNTFHALLTTNHHIDISVSLMDLSHNRISSLSPVFLGGQVNVDASGDITRSATLSFLDPDHKMALDSNSPADAAMFVDRMIGITFTVFNPDRTFWVDVPVFTGPITKMDRDWVVVRVECMGKESLALDPFWVPKTFRKGAPRADVIRSLMTELGETKFSFSATGARITKDLSLSSESKPWTTAKDVARRANLQLFYDGRGVLNLRPFPTNPVWTFTEDAGGSILSKPQMGYDVSNMINAVQVKGATPKGKKTPISYRAVAPVGSPVYPYTLGRGGKPRFIPVNIDDDSIDTAAEAKAVALARLKLGEYQSVTAAFETLPIPHLQEHDPYRISTDEISATTTIQQMTIPLVASEAASIGYLKALRPSLTNIRRRR